MKKSRIYKKLHQMAVLVDTFSSSFCFSAFIQLLVPRVTRGFYCYSYILYSYLLNSQIICSCFMILSARAVLRGSGAGVPDKMCRPFWSIVILISITNLKKSYQIITLESPKITNILRCLSHFQTLIQCLHLGFLKIENLAR